MISDFEAKPLLIIAQRSETSLFNTTKNICAMVRSRLQKEAGRLVRSHKPALNHQPSLERLKIMSTHGSATALEETPHETETTQITISDELRRRAESVINDRSIDPQWRNIIRYALEINDPWLGDIVRRAEAGEEIIDSIDFSLEPQFNEDDPNEETVEDVSLQ